MPGNDPGWSAMPEDVLTGFLNEDEEAQGRRPDVAAILLADQSPY
jgi:hypothetical protein